MRLGYNTNGFAHHRLDDALCILAELGYRSIAVTLDFHALNPYDPETSRQLPLIRDRLRELDLAVVIETGARFLLDPWRKHQPTLLTRDAAERDRRRDFLARAITIARELQAGAVSFWSGTPLDAEPESVLWDRLTDLCQSLADDAAAQNIRLAFEPEPGMFIDTLAKFRQLANRVNHPAFGLTLDIGHLHCTGEVPIAEHIREWQHCLWNVHIEDMRHGVHEHLFFGEGEIDFRPVLRTLQQEYAGGVHVELSRHGHNAVETARRAIEFLTK